MTRGPDRAAEVGRRIAGDDFDRLVAELASVDADLAEHFVQSVYGRTLSRDGLALEDRLLVSTAALGALGFEAELGRWICGALRVGVAPEAVREALVQLVPYCGWAVALNAVNSFRDVAPDIAGNLSRDPVSDVEPDRATLRARGHENARRVNPQFEKVAAGLVQFDDELMNYLVETAYGYVYDRAGLDLKRRELVAVALLTVLNQEPQLKYHIRGALNVGARPEEVREVIVQMWIHAGWPPVLRGLELWKDCTRDRD